MHAEVRVCGFVVYYQSPAESHISVYGVPAEMGLEPFFKLVLRLVHRLHMDVSFVPAAF